MKAFDRTKPFGEVYDDKHPAAFEQNGNFYNGKGELLDDKGNVVKSAPVPQAATTKDNKEK